MTARPATGGSTGPRWPTRRSRSSRSPSTPTARPPPAAQNWGAGTGLRSAGIDHVLVVSSRGAWVIDAVDRRPHRAGPGVGHRRPPGQPGHGFVRRPRPDRRRCPALSGTWRVRRAAGLATADGTSFAPVPATDGALPGQPAVYNVGFRGAGQETAVQQLLDGARAGHRPGHRRRQRVLDYRSTGRRCAAHQETPEPLRHRLLEPVVRLVARARQGRRSPTPATTRRATCARTSWAGSSPTPCTCPRRTTRPRRRRRRSPGCCTRSASTTTSTAR